MDPAPDSPPTPGLGDDAVTFYRWARRQGRFDGTDARRASSETGLSADGCREAIRILRWCGLLHAAGGPDLVAAQPPTASAALVRAQAELDRLADELRHSRQRVEQVRAVLRSVAPPRGPGDFDGARELPPRPPATPSCRPCPDRPRRSVMSSPPRTDRSSSCPDTPP
ncbi:hypothetical protein [Kitasatospora sp. LaBMicrA B282]|uniref:hypothetical protein n=1 Tax=Kitasatospora sp. LaBMicrA B282 TaxID=3420949 RepID=UPI003D0A72E7